MGIELDVLVGHPEHDLLFVATQVARATGFKDPKATIRNSRQHHGFGRHLGSLVDNSSTKYPLDPAGRTMKVNTVVFSESEVYEILMRGHSPQTEPFRKWVTEEVLPTIRKTGRYDASESSDPIAVGIMDELKPLRGELVELKEIVKALGLPVVNTRVYWGRVD
ncbi:hypothetical protein C6A77_11680 [Pseudomonas sp. AFG_SD02_1510_Pfu_092]|uniref:BRO-N domain-containing protein n=1 Tax=Pseudomonas sp. AFG_SD02_1510_Pfu_092 TaxID=2259497 RepID=UPI000DEF7BA4|nr:BRO family protein [Pseudomonas sp. AFG_SD02_1510_Pfu_092]RCL26469.1 hypothetical protein C6A77_11680 [Pseudomonas sp. AFG_SD02_1510_Pfu_092]